MKCPLNSAYGQFRDVLAIKQCFSSLLPAIQVLLITKQRSLEFIGTVPYGNNFFCLSRSFGLKLSGVLRNGVMDRSEMFWPSNCVFVAPTPKTGSITKQRSLQ